MSKQDKRKLPKYDTLMSVKISSTSKDEVLENIEKSLRNNVQFFISTPNPEIVLMAQNDKDLLKALNLSDISIPDGVGLLWAAKQLKFSHKLERIPGRELMDALFEMANRKKSKIFLLGGSSEVNKKAQNRIQKDYPEVTVTGNGEIKVDINGYSDKTDSVINEINRFKPDFLFVALGAPKQEKWIAENIKNIDANVLMTVGGALDYFVGNVPIPPKFMSKSGLEWLWRLLVQPSRFPRIFNAVVRFPLLVLRNKHSI